MNIASFLILNLLFSVVADGNGNVMCTKTATADDVADGIDLGKQVAIVTGGDNGLGYAVAETLAKQGAAVIIASHNLDKCQTAAYQISNTTGNAKVAGMSLDLGSFASVRAFVAQFTQRHQTLNYLFNNAGVSGGGMTPFKTGDGFENVFQVNYLGHFLLTELLLPLLRKSVALNMHAKIVNTASSAHVIACQSIGAPEDCFKDWTYLPTPTNLKPVVLNASTVNVSTYGVSKFAQIQHAAELAVREARNGVQAFSVCPGYVVTGMTNRTGTNFTRGCKFARDSPLHLVQDPCPYTPQEGAAVLFACALRAAHSGRWYTRYTDCSDDRPVVEQGFSSTMRPELYRRSQQWVGLQGDSASLVV